MRVRPLAKNATMTAPRLDVFDYLFVNHFVTWT